MRLTIGVVAVLVGTATLAVGADQYTSTDGKFAVTFPAGTKVTTRKQDAGGLSINITTAQSGSSRSLASAPTLGDGGPGFKAPRPDSLPRRARHDTPAWASRTACGPAHATRSPPS